MQEYTVSITSSGRSGTVTYREEGVQLEFWWEFTMSGAVISLPTEAHWNAHCERADAPAAKDRKHEIAVRIAEETCRQQCASARIEYADEWITFLF